MKKIMKLFVYVAAAAMTLASCQKNEIDNQVPQEYEYTFLIGSADTKAVIGENCVEWEQGDRVGSFTKSNNGYSEVSINEGIATISVYSSGGLAVNDKLYFYYPQVQGNEVQKTAVPMSIPTIQDAKDDMPMVSLPFEVKAESTENKTPYAGEIKFANLGAVIEFHVYSTTEAYQTEVVKSVTFNAEQAIAGDFTFDLTAVDYSKEETLAISGYEATTVVSTLSTSTQVSADKNAATVVKMVVAPGSYTGNVVVTTDKAIYTYPISTAKAFKRSGVQPFGLNLRENVRQENSSSEPVEITATLTFDDKSKRTEYSTLKQVWTENGIILTNEKEDASTNVGDYSQPARFYKGSKIYVEAPGNIVNIVFNCNSSEYATDLNNSITNSYRSGNDVTVTLEGNSTKSPEYKMSAKVFVNSVTVTYMSVEGGETPEQPATPVLTVNPQVVEVEAAGGAEEITYTVTNPVEGTSVDASTEATWITNLTTSEGKVTFNVEEHIETAGRTATITLAYEGAESVTITVTQAGKPAEGGETETVEWVATSFADLKEGDQVVIVSTNGSNIYAMSNNNGTDSAPAAVSITYANNKLTSEPAETIVWTVSVDGTNYIFHPNGDTAKWLYCTDTNNGVRVGTNTNKTFNIDSESGYMVHAGTNRYIGVYNNANWRCYTSINDNIKNQTFQFFVKQGGSSEGGGETPEPKVLESIAVSDATINYVVGDEFKKPTVTATYNDATTADVTASATFSDYDMGAAGTQTVTVSYTEGDKTVTTTYKIEVVEPQELPEGIANIKTKATSTTETEFAVTLTDAVVTYVSDKNAYVEDAEAGILIYKSGHGLAAGDKLNGVVSGKVKLYNGLREITDIDYSKATKTEAAEIPVTVLTLEQLNAEGAYDRYENMRIKIVDVTVSADKQISQDDQTYALYFKNNTVTGFELGNIIDVIGYPSKYNSIQFNIWENAVVKSASKTTISGVSDVTIQVGETTVINAVASSGAKVTYVSGNSAIAKVDENGTVTGVAEGETTITVSVPAYNGYPAAEEVCNVTVTAASQGGGDESQEATWHAETWTNCKAGKDTYGSATFVGDLGSWSYTGCSAYDATQFNTKKSLALGKTADNSSITSPNFDNGIKGIKFNYYANDTARKVVVKIYENGAVVKTETIKPSAKNTLLSAEISVETSGATYFIFTPGSASRRVSVGDIQVKY